MAISKQQMAGYVYTLHRGGKYPSREEIAKMHGRDSGNFSGQELAMRREFLKQLNIQLKD